MTAHALRLVARCGLVVLSLVLGLAVVEAGLRVVYRDAGAQTLGGPGGDAFDHWTIDGTRRGRLEVGEKKPGVPRVMVVGDSISYGLGVRDWRETWPERLRIALEDDRRRHEFAVFAVPGNDMPQHLDTMRAWAASVAPDILIYQWYVNDLEAISHRPSVAPPWRQWSSHTWLRESSYLYFVLDHRIGHVLWRPDRRYVDYLRADFAPGTIEWTEFEREFHEFAIHAMQARRRIMLLYPQVPYRGRYPLQAVHDRMRELAGAHLLHVPPIAWIRRAGSLVGEQGTPWGQSVHARDGGLSIETGEYVFAPGNLEIALVTVGSAKGLMRVELIDVAHAAVFASTMVRLVGSDSRGAPTTARFSVPGDRLRRLAIRVTVEDSSADWGLADLHMPVDYGWEVIDLTEPLNTFDTHTSAFDSHPNARAHQVMADILYAALSARP